MMHLWPGHYLHARVNDIQMICCPQQHIPVQWVCAAFRSISKSFSFSVHDPFLTASIAFAGKTIVAHRPSAGKSPAQDDIVREKCV
jgi:hypothetical protein